MFLTLKRQESTKSAVFLSHSGLRGFFWWVNRQNPMQLTNEIDILFQKPFGLMVMLVTIIAWARVIVSRHAIAAMGATMVIQT